MPERARGSPPPTAAASAGAGSMRSAHAPSTSDGAASTAKTGARPASAAAAPTTGPNIAPNIAAPSAPPISWPRRSRGATASSHANAPAHVKPLPPPWTRRAAEQRPEAAGEGEAEAREPDERQPDQHRPPRAEPRRRDPARQPGDERARRVGRDEDARPRLREPELVREVRQERRQRRVQHRVDEDEHGDEQQQTAHGGHATKAHAGRRSGRYRCP